MPDRILQVAAIPYTLTGKKLEVPVRRILSGVPPEKAANRDAMANPAALDFFIDLRADAARLRPVTVAATARCRRGQSLKVRKSSGTLFGIASAACVAGRASIRSSHVQLRGASFSFRISGKMRRTPATIGYALMSASE